MNECVSQKLDFVQLPIVIQPQKQQQNHNKQNETKKAHSINTNEPQQQFSTNDSSALFPPSDKTRKTEIFLEIIDDSQMESEATKLSNENSTQTNSLPCYFKNQKFKVQSLFYGWC